MGNRIVPALLTRDMKTTLQFYTALGFQVAGGDDWAEVARDGVVLQFHSTPPVGTPEQPMMSGTLYFYIGEVDALAAEFTGKATFEWGPEVMPYGLKEFGLRDPNGYYLAFAEEVTDEGKAASKENEWPS
jgi:catechol 2,3-dioxygenase-like lactoylglutathione lyase family enzyme